TNTPTLIPTLTWTPLPTLSAQEVNTKIKELLETNGGCELPCWWGITPYKTSWPEALHFLTPIIGDIGQGGSSTFYEGENKHFTTTFEVSYEIRGFSKPGRIAFELQDNVVVAITVFPPGTQNKYQLHHILALFGVPKQIYISAQSSKAWSETFTVFVLDYSDIGVWAFYSYVPAIHRDSFFACPNSTGAELFLFDPQKEYTQGVSIVEAAEMFRGVPVRKLEDATTMTMENFYDAFVAPDSGLCLETLVNLWP
ncbi:MAG: hypothetical protein Q7T89_13050, partial [Anaerolineales bacterium]|nr:hypothetical protein [Anaerolineales bacterium]